jgi:hypothetical protein
MPELSDYEKKREANIKRNAALMQSMGLNKAAENAKKLNQRAEKKRKKSKTKRKSSGMAAPSRRSSRGKENPDLLDGKSIDAADGDVAIFDDPNLFSRFTDADLAMHIEYIPNVPEKNFNNVEVLRHPAFHRLLADLQKDCPRFNERLGQERNHGEWDLTDDAEDLRSDLLTAGVKGEVSEATALLLRLIRVPRGHLEIAKGGRVSCHWHRHSTFDRKTSCTRCDDFHGKDRICGPCLWSRYQINILDTLYPDPESGWLGPYCLDQCNCSGKACGMQAKGIKVTGQLAKVKGQTTNETIESHKGKKVFGFFEHKYEAATGAAAEGKDNEWKEFAVFKDGTRE